ncbi:hypothetical protein JX266_000139 [Neoarthrinium moseri]|nr:hypothetical protein JX266_000139 [Neoarthrinium moseri]
MTTESHNEPIRLFPSPRVTKATSIPLSILDSTCARFGNTGAVWLFGAPESGQQEVGREFVDTLKSSFVATLSDFPQWAGQLHWAPFRLGGHHTERFNRAMITYGCESDPGVEWNVVHHDFTLNSILPGSSEVLHGVWLGDTFPQGGLISPRRMALSNLKDCEGMPGMQVQINVFACGGYGVGIKLAHPLADASSMMVFVHQWAAKSRGLFGEPSSSLFDGPVFDPSQLDSRAAGHIDGDALDDSIAQTARSLPLHRFSWWDTDEPGYSPWLVASTKNSMPPADVLDQMTVAPSTIGPWRTWDLTRPVSWGLLHFTGRELLHLKSLALQGVPEGTTISQTDALMAVMFRLITRSRAYTQADDDKVFLNVTLDARRRVSPPLSETSIGSPLLLTHVKGLASAVRSASIGELALRLRTTIQLFTPDKMAAILHDAAYEVSPQRLWLGFIGTLHIIATSWQRLKLYEVIFDKGGKRPQYVHSVMDKCDGTLVILDPITTDGGVDIALYLDAEAMSHFREELRKERNEMAARM